MFSSFRFEITEHDSRSSISTQQLRLYDIAHRPNPGVGSKSSTKLRQPSRGQGFPIEVILQHGSVASRCPGSATMWSLAQSAFVDEDDDVVQARAGYDKGSGNRCFVSSFAQLFLGVLESLSVISPTSSRSSLFCF